MNFRRLGQTGLSCSVLGLGTGKLAALSSGVSTANALRLIAVAADFGINFIDTADSYGQGESEKVIGKALRGKRDKFIIATKAGYRFSRFIGLVCLAKPLLKRVLRGGGRKLAGDIRSGAPKTKILRQDFSPQHIRRAVEGSLRRLQTDYVDLFFLHDVPIEALGVDELFDRLGELKRAGKIRHFGVSSNHAAVLESARRRPGVTLAQTAINPARPADLWPVLSRLESAGFGVVANQIFNSGKLLAAKDPVFQERIERVRQNRQMSAQQILIQFAAAQPAVFSVLTGTTNPAHLRQNVEDLLSTSALTMEEIAFLRGATRTIE